jgi:hypothetical protein
MSAPSPSLCLRLQLLLLQLLSLATLIEGKKRKKGRSTNIRDRTKSFSEFGLIIGVTLVVLVLPLLITFVYKILKDPATPNVIKYYWSRFKENGFGYLGSNQRSDTSDRQQPRPRNRRKGLEKTS